MSAGSPSSRSRTSASRLAGNGSPASSPIDPRSTARASSSAKKGFPPESSCRRRSLGRGSTRPSLSRRRRWRAPRLSGPSVSRRSALLGERAVEPERHPVAVPVGPLGEEEEDALLAEAAQRELEHEGRRAVEPLDVVHRDHERGGLRQRPQRAQERDRHRAVVRRLALRVLEQQGDLERAALRRRQLRERVGEHGLEQVGERREGEPRLRSRRRRPQNPVAERRRQLEPRSPEDRLPDARLTLDEEGAREPVDGGEEGPELGELLLAADDLRRHRHLLCRLRHESSSAGRRVASRVPPRRLSGLQRAPASALTASSGILDRDAVVAAQLVLLARPRARVST